MLPGLTAVVNAWIRGRGRGEGRCMRGWMLPTIDEGSSLPILLKHRVCYCPRGPNWSNLSAFSEMKEDIMADRGRFLVIWPSSRGHVRRIGVSFFQTCRSTNFFIYDPISYMFYSLHATHVRSLKRWRNEDTFLLSRKRRSYLHSHVLYPQESPVFGK